MVAGPDDGGRRDGFWFVAHNLALDFVNTQMMEAGELTDRLPDPSALSRWAAAVGLCERPLPVSAGLFAEAIALRRSLREAFDGLVARGDVPSEAIDHLNRLLRCEPPTQITRRPGGFECLRTGEVVEHPELLLWRIADAAADLLGGPLLERVKKCASMACVLYFADTTRGGTRRWCSIQVCGNRAKAATYYHRRRGRGGREGTTRY